MTQKKYQQPKRGLGSRNFYLPSTTITLHMNEHSHFIKFMITPEAITC